MGAASQPAAAAAREPAQWVAEPAASTTSTAAITRIPLWQLTQQDNLLLGRIRRRKQHHAQLDRGAGGAEPKVPATCGVGEVAE